MLQEFKSVKIRGISKTILNEAVSEINETTHSGYRLVSAEIRYNEKYFIQLNFVKV